jgi:chromosome segregation ATPase
MSSLQQRYNILQGRQQALQEAWGSKKNKLTELQIEVEDTSKARWVLTEVAKLTQERFKERTENLVTLALRSVFPERDFKFTLVFEQKRNRFVVRPVIMEGDNEFSFEDDQGGSIVDIVSFAFRIVLWSLEKPRSRPLFWLDEPDKNMGEGEYLQRSMRVKKELAEKLGLQIVMISHKSGQIEEANKAFRVVMEDKISKVSEV